MKKTILMLALAFGMGAYAQDSTSESKGFSTGDFTVTGSVGFGSTKVNDQKSNTFQFAPMVGYHITDNFSLGLFAAIGSTKTDPADEKSSTFAVGPMARYYFNPKNDFSFFLQLAAGFQGEKHSSPGDEDEKYNGFGVAFSPGVSYFVSDNFAIQAHVGIISYDTMKLDDDNVDLKRDNFNFGWNSANLNFGLLYKF